jgi:hypothetical protein
VYEYTAMEKLKDQLMDDEAYRQPAGVEKLK